MTPARVIVCVCGRMGSERLPDKALVDICGHPSIWYPIHRSMQSPYSVVFCTPKGFENDRLSFRVGSWIIPIYRSQRHAAREMLRACESERAGHVVRVTGDDIMVDPDLMERAVTMHLKEGSDYTTMPAVQRGWDSEVISLNALELAANAEEPELLGNVFPHLPIKRLVTALSTPFKPPMELNMPEDLERIRGYVAAHNEEVLVA